MTLALSDQAIACHITIDSKDGDDEGEGDWKDHRIRQCAGAANFRANICKVPRNPAVDKGVPDDSVFGRPAEFIEYHAEANELFRQAQ